MSVDSTALWTFLPIGYFLTIAIETPILLIGLSARHSISRKLIAGVWLTACTYPIVILVLPLVVEAHLGRGAYIACAEVFAPVAECLLFWLAFCNPPPSRTATVPGHQIRSVTYQDLIAITIANLCSWLLGGWLLAK
jgi:hypothetical protein